MVQSLATLFREATKQQTVPDPAEGRTDTFIMLCNDSEDTAGGTAGSGIYHSGGVYGYEDSQTLSSADSGKFGEIRG